MCVKSLGMQSSPNQQMWYQCFAPDVKVIILFFLFCVCAESALENGDTELSTEEPWDQKEAEPDEEEPGGGDRGPEMQATPEELPPGMMEEEEEAPVPKVPPTQPDAPRKEHVNVVFIGHVGQFIHLLTFMSLFVLFRSNTLLKVLLGLLNDWQDMCDFFLENVWGKYCHFFSALIWNYDESS